jgi:transposase
VKVMHDRVAAIDVHKDMVKVAVRVPGERRGTRKTDVLEFRTFYGVLEEMGRELRRRGVTHVVMEASGVYTEPVYYALAGLDFTEVMVINPAHAKALKGHKTDARDAIRLLDLYECGLLSGSYIPAPDLKEVQMPPGPAGLHCAVSGCDDSGAAMSPACTTVSAPTAHR